MVRIAVKEKSEVNSEVEVDCQGWSKGLLGAGQEPIKGWSRDSNKRSESNNEVPE